MRIVGAMFLVVGTFSTMGCVDAGLCGKSGLSFKRAVVADAPQRSRRWRILASRGVPAAHKPVSRWDGSPIRGAV